MSWRDPSYVHDSLISYPTSCSRQGSLEGPWSQFIPSLCLGLLMGHPWLCWRQQHGAPLARRSAGRRQHLAEQHRAGTGASLPIPAVADWPASSVHGEGPPLPGRMGQANCCCGSRWALPVPRGHGRDPRRRRPFSCPPLSALQGGSHRRRAGAERGRAADPGPQEERETPSPPPGGTGDRQVATRHHAAPTAPPGPGPAVGAERRKGGSRGGKRGGKRR
ncbi:uncharacterized protein ACIBXB_000927 [Morphnus guianensis]